MSRSQRPAIQNRTLRKTRQYTICVMASVIISALALRAQVSVNSLPPAALLDTANGLTFKAQVSGTLPGEDTSVTWSLNDGLLGNTSSITLPPGGVAEGFPPILKATSNLDASRFAAVPLVFLTRSDLAQVAVPDAVAYHPSTGFVYVASLVPHGGSGNVDSVILKVAPDGTQSTVATLTTAVIDKLIPYVGSNGTPYLLAADYENNQIVAVDLNSGAFRRVVGGLASPASAAIDPVSGDLYIADLNGQQATTPHSIAVVSRAALDAAVTGTSTAPIQGLPFIIGAVSGVGFVTDPASQKVSLLGVTNNGVLYQVDLTDNSYQAVATGISAPQQLLIVQSPQLGFSFVLTGSSTRSGNTVVDGGGQITALSPSSSGQAYGPAYAVASGLDGVTDIAFVPPGTPYSKQGRWLLLAASSSATASRGKIVSWEPGPAVPENFFAYGGQVQPAVQLISPASGEPLMPGSPVEVRWSYADGNPLNSGAAAFAGLSQILVSTDGGNSFSPAGPVYLPSGPQQGNQYSQIWQVPANLAGQTIRLEVQMTGLDGTTMNAVGTSDLLVLDQSSNLPKPLFLNPNFAVAGQNATIEVNGLNFQAATTVDFGSDVPVSSTNQVSSSRIEAQLQPAALATTGARAVLACNPAGCQQTQNAFFVLSQNGPRITSISPQSGSPGGTVTVTGENFSGVAANNVVTIGNFTATVSLATPTSLSVQVPFGLNRGELPLSVQTDGVSSNSATFYLVPPGFTVPFINADGVVNGASFSPGTVAVAPGSIISAFGNDVVPNIAKAAATPLPRQLLNTTLMIGGVPAPLFFAAPIFSPGGQINGQVPEEMAGLSSVAVSLVANGIAGNTVLLNLAAQNAGIFSMSSDGKGPGAVLNQDGTLNSAANPEHIGNVLQIFATGLGSANPPVPSGAAAPSDPLAMVTAPAVTIDGVPATVTFAGRAPGFVGLDQVNVTIPAGVTTGNPVALVMTGGPNKSNSVTVSIAP